MWQVATYNRAMAHSIRISDDLYALAQTASQALERPLAQQMEYWARLGAALDAAGLSASSAMKLLGKPGAADAFVAGALEKKDAQKAKAVRSAAASTEARQGLAILKAQQIKDAKAVRAGRRPARSLWVVQKGDLEGVTITPNPRSKFSQVGDGW